MDKDIKEFLVTNDHEYTKALCKAHDLRENFEVDECYVYLTLWEDGSFYIGSTINSIDSGYRGSTPFVDLQIARGIKCMRENLEVVFDRGLAFKLEQFYIQSFKTLPKCVNTNKWKLQNKNWKQEIENYKIKRTKKIERKKELERKKKIDRKQELEYYKKTSLCHWCGEKVSSMYMYNLYHGSMCYNYNN